MNEKLPIIPWDTIEIGDQIGEGGFGAVYKGYSIKLEDIALKKMRFDMSNKDFDDFQHEVNLLSSLKSKYIINLWGITISDANERYMVMEYMPNKSLYDYLRYIENNNLIDQFQWEKRLKISLDITRGLDALHSQKIVHRDLKSLNILLDEHLSAKISDFGLSFLKANTQMTVSPELKKKCPLFGVLLKNLIFQSLQVLKKISML